MNMKNYTREDILNLVEEEDVGFIRLQFTDIFGTMKNVAITVSQLKRALDNKCMFDGSSIEGFARIEESDMYLHPDLNTFEIFPWRPQQGKVARFICDIYRPDGTAYESDPRYVLKKVLSKTKEMGYDFNVGPECEFFLFETDDAGNPTTISNERAGYFDLGPLDQGENARRDIVLTMEDMGYGVEASHHEMAPAQHEIDLEYTEALDAADNIMTFKLVTKTIAKRHGLHTTFLQIAMRFFLRHIITFHQKTLCLFYKCLLLRIPVLKLCSSFLSPPANRLCHHLDRVHQIKYLKWHRQADHSRRPVTAFLRRCDQKHLNRTRQIISQFII